MNINRVRVIRHTQTFSSDADGRVFLCPPEAVKREKWSPTALQPWSLWYLRRNPPKHVLLLDGFGGHPSAFLHGLNAVASCVGG